MHCNEWQYKVKPWLFHCLQSLSWLLGLERERHAALFENPGLVSGVPYPQKIKRANGVVLLGRRARLVPHDLRNDSNRHLHPFRQALERAAQAVQGQAIGAGNGRMPCGARWQAPVVFLTSLQRY